MNCENLALVRVLSDKYNVPVDGKIAPISEVPYLCRENKTPFYFEMRNVLRRKSLLGHPENPMSQKDEEEKVLQYMPYSSSYNSMTLWTINGVVPDDNYATFSNKTCAVMDSLQEQLKKSKIVSMAPTDVAIHGTTDVSSSAVIFIKKDRYASMSEEDKQILAKNYSKIKIFEENIREAVNEELISSGRYTAETLSLDRGDSGYKKSPTSEQVIDEIAKTAKEKEIPQVLHLNVITGEHDEKDKLEEFKDDKLKMNMIKKYYKQTFFEYLFARMDIDEYVKAWSMRAPDSYDYMEQLGDEIGRIGLDKYKEVLDEYNQSLEKLKDTGKLPTPQQIIDAYREDKKIDLLSMIEQERNKDNVLASAIEATEEEITTSDIKEQEEKISQIEMRVQTKETEIE